MTDARAPERWLNDVRFRKLSDKGFRTYFNSLLWAVANRRDGILMPDELGFIPDVSVDEVDFLVKLNLWQTREDGGWTITDYSTTQTSREQLEGLERRKRQDADRARTYRGRRKDKVLSRNRSRDESRDDLGQARTGQDRRGQDRRVLNEDSSPEQLLSLTEEQKEVIWADPAKNL